MFAMSRVPYVILSLALGIISAFSQSTSFQDTLLDGLSGHWILQGTIAGRETIHDIDAEWVLGHQYLQFREVSREKDSTGAAAYEATVFIGWDQNVQEYACLWLDVTGGGGLTANAIGHAPRSSDQINFLFKGSDGNVFHTNFIYGRDADTWKWLMDSEDHGKLQPFARVALRRASQRGQ